MNDVLMTYRSPLLNVCVHRYAVPAKETPARHANENEEIEMPPFQLKKLPPEQEKISASHQGLMALIRTAKNNSDPWAEQALAELNFIMCMDYRFEIARNLGGLGFKYEIVSAP